MKGCFWTSLFCFLGSYLMFTKEEPYIEGGYTYLVLAIILMSIAIFLFIRNKRHPEIQAQKEQRELERAKQKMICPRCHGSNTNVQIISEQKGTSFLGVLFYIFLAITLVGIPIMLIILLCKGKKTITHKQCVCQDCGNSWMI